MAKILLERLTVLAPHHHSKAFSDGFALPPCIENFGMDVLVILEMIETFSRLFMNEIYKINLSLAVICR